MKTLEPPISPSDDLDRLELKIARRADELTLHAGGRGRDLEHWLQAEREVIARCPSKGHQAPAVLPARVPLPPLDADESKQPKPRSAITFRSWRRDRITTSASAPVPHAWPCSHAKFEDVEFVDGLRAGSAQALAEIMAAYQPRIYAQALRQTRNHHEAEEIVQETFIRAYQAGPNFRGESSLATWLHAITGNLVRNRYWHGRRRRRHQIVSLDELSQSHSGLALRDALVGEDQTAAEESEQNELAEQIAKGMGRLAERDRRILTLRTVQHAAYTEIARALGIALGTVKSRLARARGRLRVLVQEEIGEEAAFIPNASGMSWSR